MPENIYPCLWCDNDAKPMAEFYLKAFGNGRITAETPPTVMFELFGQTIMGLNGGPVFQKNPSISFFVTFDNEAEITAAWNALIEGGTALMPFQQYPWAKKYGWLRDKFGTTWQLSWSDLHAFPQRLTPLLMFVGDKAGKAEEAIGRYTAMFPNSSTDMLARYEAGEGDTPGLLKHARFTLDGHGFMAMDSSLKHAFDFNEGVSIVVVCKDQAEVDHYWTKLLEGGGEESMCGWLKDAYGVSWQIVPARLLELVSSKDKKVAERAMTAMMGMRKIEIDKLDA